LDISSANIQTIYTKYKISPERAEHSLGVAEIASELAEKYGEDPGKAWLAGALHDIARDWTDAKLTEYALSHEMGITEEERRFPPLLHGRVAAEVAKNELGVQETEILAAISHHTSGKANMDKLEMLLYLADFLESTDEMPKYQHIRDKLAVSLPKTVNLVNQATKEHVRNQGYELSKDFLENIDFYSKYQ